MSALAGSGEGMLGLSKCPASLCIGTWFVLVAAGFRSTSIPKPTSSAVYEEAIIQGKLAG